MLLRGREFERRGVANEFWFCEPSVRWPEFQATGRATLAPLEQLARRLSKGDVDVIQMPASDPAALLVARFAGRARIVVTGHGALADVWSMRNCFGYTAISKGTAERCQPYTDIEIVVVQNAIDPERFQPPSARAGGPPIIAFAGRTDAIEKDFPRFTRIAKRLVARGARVWVADPRANSWEKFEGRPIERIPVERWTHVLSADMPAFYREVAASGGVVVMTSVTEGFGNVAPEASACGARVAAPDRAGFRDSVIADVTGILFRAEASDDEVADRLRAYLAAPHDMHAVAAATHAAFSPSRMSEGYLAAYERGPRPAPRRDATPPVDVGTAVLLAHLREQRTWRARLARRDAVGLARAGLRSHALYALWLAATTEPREFAKRIAWQQLVATARWWLRPVGFP